MQKLIIDKLKLGILLSFLFSFQLVHATCLVNTSTAPACPNTGTTTLDETYPAQAYVVSANPRSNEAREMPSTFIYEIMRANNFQDGPYIYVPSTQASYDNTVANLRVQLTNEGKSAQQIRDILARVVHVSTPTNWTWQQDYFESFFDPRTGSPVLRQVQSYDRGSPTESVTGMASAGADCGVSQGSDLLPISPNPNSEMGGNIEALPGGRCMIGNNQDPLYTDQFCGDRSNRVIVDTDWLAVGHADEIIKVVPDSPATGSCPYTFMFASPRKGLDVLRGDPSGKIIDIGTVAAEPASTYDTRVGNAVKARLAPNGHMNAQGRLFCELYERYIRPTRTAPASPDAPPPAGGSDQTYIPIKLLDMLIPKAHAARPLGYKTRTIYSDCLSHIHELAQVTNQEFVTAYNQEQSLVTYNNVVQSKIDADKARIRRLYPSCGSSKFKDVPDIFFGDLIPDSDPPQIASGAGSSLFPNPTNSVRVSNSVLFPDPMNSAFRAELSSNVLTGMTPRFVNTWDYAHTQDGNLHCSTHAIRYCRPRE